MKNKEKNFMSAVIYVHNCEKRIDTFLRTIMLVLEENFEHSEIICVNDGSVDNSVDVIKRVSKEATLTSISVINMSHFHGLEMAMNAGVELSIGDFVYEFDSTVLDFDKSEIMKVYKKSLEGFDIVSATPNRKQKVSSSLFYSVFKRFTKFSYEMYTESFRVLSRRVINRVSGMNKTIPYRKAVYANCGLKIDKIVYEPVKRDCEEEKISDLEKNYRKRLATDTLILFTEVGYKFSVAMTTLMMFITVFMAIYSVIIYILKTPIAGWTTTILFLSFCFFGLFGILTVVIKYLQILVDLVFRRKQYSFESIEKLTK